MIALLGPAGRRRARLTAVALSAVLLGACTSVEVTPGVGATERLPRPDRVLVYNFAVTPGEIQLDAVGSAITRNIDGTADSAQEREVVCRRSARRVEEATVSRFRAGNGGENSTGFTS